MTLNNDAKSSIVLSASFALAAVFTVPLLLPSLPEEARKLPLPLWAFCFVLAVQLTVVYGLLALAGCRLSRRAGREPVPALTALWTWTNCYPSRHQIGAAASTGLACGVFLVAVIGVIKHLLPNTLPKTVHPPGIAAALAASSAGAIGEEILFRLFALSVLLRVIPSGKVGVSVAVAVSAAAYGIAHAPGFVFLFGGLNNVPFASWIWLMGLNGLCGVTFAIVYLRSGIECAILTHLATDVVWHAASQTLAS
jgi:hypothetical protein